MNMIQYAASIFNYIWISSTCAFCHLQSQPRMVGPSNLVLHHPIGMEITHQLNWQCQYRLNQMKNVQMSWCWLDGNSQPSSCMPNSPSHSQCMALTETVLHISDSEHMFHQISAPSSWPNPWWNIFRYIQNIFIFKWLNMNTIYYKYDTGPREWIRYGYEYDMEFPVFISYLASTKLHNARQSHWLHRGTVPSSHT